MQEKTISLVLSSGGAKGYAHIGVIKALEEEGYKIVSVAGTSMGTLVGGLYAAGKLDEAYEWLSNIDNWEVFKLADLKNISKSGLINGEYIFEELHRTILLNSFYIALKQNKLEMVERMAPDIYINIDLQGYKTQSFTDAEVIATLGYDQTKLAIQQSNQNLLPLS